MPESPVDSETLERQYANQAIELSPEQAAFLEKLKPCFRERQVESGRPSQLLSVDTFMVGTLKSIGRVYLHAVIDTFGFIHVSNQPESRSPSCTTTCRSMPSSTCRSARS
jgi:hypothetical protein